MSARAVFILFISEHTCRTIRSFPITMSDPGIYDSPEIVIGFAFFELLREARSAESSARLFQIWRKTII